jgi:hypothetical protein
MAVRALLGPPTLENRFATMVDGNRSGCDAAPVVYSTVSGRVASTRRSVPFQ